MEILQIDKALGGFYTLLLTCALVVALLSAGGVICKDIRKWFLRAGKYVLAAGVVGPFLVSGLSANREAGSMAGLFVGIILIPAGLLLLMIGVCMRKPRAAPPPLPPDETDSQPPSPKPPAPLPPR
ncbi:MAG: hypothetical protein KKH28_09165 [Elusimicrobia bacterium]|nr:hypothetical protein [Elusimicrobiota bacterium]